MWLHRVWIGLLILLVGVFGIYAVLPPPTTTSPLASASSSSTGSDILEDSSFALLVPQSDSNGNGINCVKDDIYLEYYERLDTPPKNCNLPYFFSNILPTFFVIREKGTERILYASSGLIDFLNDNQVIIDPTTASVTSILSSFQPIVFACDVDIDGDGNMRENPDDLIQIGRMQTMDLGLIGQFFDGLKNSQELGLQSQRIDPFYQRPYYEELFPRSCHYRYEDPPGSGAYADINPTAPDPKPEDPKITYNKNIRDFEFIKLVSNPSYNPSISPSTPQWIPQVLPLVENEQEVEVGSFKLKLPKYVVEKDRSDDGIFTFEIPITQIQGADENSRVRLVNYVSDVNHQGYVFEEVSGKRVLMLDANNGNVWRFINPQPPSIPGVPEPPLDRLDGVWGEDVVISTSSSDATLRANINLRKVGTGSCPSGGCSLNQLEDFGILLIIVGDGSPLNVPGVPPISAPIEENIFDRLNNQENFVQDVFLEKYKVVPIYLINSRKVNEINLDAESSYDSSFIINNWKGGEDYYIRGAKKEDLLNDIESPGIVGLSTGTFLTLVQNNVFYLACKEESGNVLSVEFDPLSSAQLELGRKGNCQLFLYATFKVSGSDSYGEISPQVIPIGSEFTITDFNEDNGKDITEEILTATALHSKIPFYGPEDINVCGKNKDGKVVNVFDKCSLGGDEGQCGDLELCECRENNIVRGKFQCRVKENLDTPNYCLLIGNTKREKEDSFDTTELAFDGEKCGIANNIFFYKLPSQKLSQNLWYTISFIDREWSIERIRRSFGAVYNALASFFDPKNFDKLPDDMVLICRSEDTCANKK